MDRFSSFRRKLVCLALTTACMSVSVPAFAATDGNAGATTTGTMNIELTKGDAVRISELQDIYFAAGTTLPPKQIDDVCVYSTTGAYTVTASSQGNGSGGTQFRMLSGVTSDFVRYFVEWRPDTFSQNGDALLHNQPSSTYNNADNVSDNCSGGVNSRIIIEIDSATFNAALPDSYTDVLTLLVQPI